jgi:hypothetical protein
MVGIGALFLFACGAEADPPSSLLDPEGASLDGAPSTKAQAIAIEPGGAPHEVYLQATPNSLCRLQAIGAASDHGDLVADEHGVVHTTLSTPNPGGDDFELDCEAGGVGGARTRYPVTITATTEPTALAATKEAMAPLAALKSGTYRPPLAGDPMSYGPGWLLEHGYGRRPDPEKRPALYAKWAQSVAREGRIVTTSTVSMPTRLVHAPNERSSPHVWAGLLGPYYGPTTRYHFDDAWVLFTAPPVSSPFSTTNTATVSIWAGIGGTNVSDGFWQVGVDAVATTTCRFPTHFCVTHASYIAWAEANASRDIYPGITINTNDDVWAEAWVCETSSGNYTDVDPEDPNAGLCYAIYDFNTGQSNSNAYVATVASWIGKTNVFHTAEAMVENPITAAGVPTLLAVFPRLTLQEPMWCNSAVGFGVQNCGDLATAPGAETYQLVQGADTLATSCVTDDSTCTDSGLDVWVTFQHAF